MTRDWPRFAPDAACPKCGHADVGSIYHDGWVYRFPLSREGEWIERTCRRCHYCWPEECVPPMTTTDRSHEPDEVFRAAIARFEDGEAAEEALTERLADALTAEDQA